MQKKLQVPVAIINSSVGGTEIECWMSKEALAPFPDAVKAGKKREYLYESYPRRHQEFLQKNPQWEKQFNRTDDLPLLPEANAVWKTAKPPVAFGNGIYFLRTTVNISPVDAAKGFQINLRRTHTPMTLFIDGKCVKSCTAAAAYKKEYANDPINIIDNWFMLCVFILAFAMLATVVLELIDKDKR